MGIPYKVRTTHQWLQPLYNWLEGKTSDQLQLGSSTGILGLYGATGAPRLSSAAAAYGGGGGAGYFSGVTGAGIPIGPSGTAMYNGGTGTFYATNDVVRALKNAGILPA